MNQRFERFLTLSERLTGFNRVPLLGTGVSDQYLNVVEAELPSGILDDLLAAFDRALADENPNEAIASQLCGDARFGPIIRSVILLWYCGTWTALSDEWCTAYGPCKSRSNYVVSAQSYQSGLQWAVAGAHPPGARQQGFGAWSRAPSIEGT